MFETLCIPAEIRQALDLLRHVISRLISNRVKTANQHTATMRSHHDVVKLPSTHRAARVMFAGSFLGVFSTRRSPASSCRRGPHVQQICSEPCLRACNATPPFADRCHRKLVRRLRVARIRDCSNVSGGCVAGSLAVRCCAKVAACPSPRHEGARCPPGPEASPQIAPTISEPPKDIEADRVRPFSSRRVEKTSRVQTKGQLR